MKEINGCDKDSVMGERWIIGEYRLKRCPLKEITQEGFEYVEAYKFYKNGILPIHGGWTDQTHTFVEAMRIIDSEVEKIEKQMSKEKSNGR